MKVPAIRAKMGLWVYYVATLKFSQIKEYVKRIDDELHKSTILREMLQRSITDNYKSIANYIVEQEEHFFNSLVLAVYDGDPKWHEIRLDYGDEEEYFDIGLLELTGEEKIFPVDGQHRVEGIKKVLEESTEFDDEKIPVIFIGHKKDASGMQRARRLFSTLNRYAKPVSMRDIIALDEDDAIAIASRDLIESNVLFEDNRILDVRTKAIPDSNKTAFTSIITFYECNRELLVYYLNDRNVVNAEGKVLKGNSKVTSYIKFRPAEDELMAYKNLCSDFWSSFAENINVINEYVSKKPDSTPYRNKDGGSILFRPAALIPLVKAIVKIAIRTNEAFGVVLRKINELPLLLTDPVWNGILWDSNNKKMIMNNNATTELLLMFLYNRKLLTEKELLRLEKGFARARQIDIESAKERLKEF